MKGRIGAVVMAIMSLYGMDVYAETASEVEEAAFALCVGDNQESIVSQACTDWIVSGTCLSTYVMRQEALSKQISEDKLHEYRLAAEARLPETCEPSMAVRLNLDILAREKSPEERQKRWERIIFWSNKLVSEQRVSVVKELVYQPDFSSLKAQVGVRMFVEHCRNEAVNMLPELSNDTADFLMRLEKEDSSYIDNGAQLVLLLDDIKTKRFLSARERCGIVDVTKLDEAQKKLLASRVDAFALGIFGHADFSDAVCLTETLDTLHADRMQPFYEMIQSYHRNDIIIEHQAAYALKQCDFEKVAKIMSDYYGIKYSQSDCQNMMTQILEYAEKTRFHGLIEALMFHFDQMPAQAIAAYKAKYGVRMTRLAIEATERFLMEKNASRAEKTGIPLMTLAPESMKNEVFLLCGRVRFLQQNGMQARQLWDQVIQNVRTGSLAERAYYLSILSFMSEGKQVDADMLRRQFEETIPASSWLKRLPEQKAK